jgi:hypothetical protein
MNTTKAKFIALLVTALSCALFVQSSYAAVTFVSATNSVTLTNTIDEDNERIFVFGGIASGDSTELSFATDSACPGVAMTGGAEFTTNWSCAAGVITATVTYRGGMSFGPGPEGPPTTFYVTFSNPPTPPGLDSPPAELSGIQISVFGDVSRWDLSGEMSSSGVTFGIELSGTQGGEAHFRMDLPQAAANFLGGVLGVYVGGKPDPFANVTTNDDGSVSLDVDIASLKSANGNNSKVGSQGFTEATSKITTGARTLGIAFNKTTIKTGKSVSLAMCAGTQYKSGAKVAIQFSMNGKSVGLKKNFILDKTGCAKTTVKLKSIRKGTLTAKIKYKKTAKATIKVTK